MGFALRVVDVAPDLREERGVSREDLVERPGRPGVLEEVGELNSRRARVSMSELERSR